MPTARISEITRKILRDLARRTGSSMQEILENAVEEYRRRRFLDECNAAFQALRRDPEAWKEEESERALWEATLSDDLERD